MRIGKFIAKNKVLSFFILLLIFGFGYYFWLHRHPRTDNAFVVANIRPVSSLVNGHITDIYVVNNQKVKKGDKLFTVYKKPYELTVESFKNQLIAEKYQAAALKEQIKKSKLQIKEAKAEYQNTVYLADQADTLYKTRAVSQKSAEKLDRARDEAKAKLDMAVSTLTIDEQLYNRSVAICSDLAAQFDNAKVNLALTTIYAQSNGLISNMFISKGTYANNGVPLFSFIDTEHWWVQANLKETEIGNVKSGQKVNIRLWLYPRHLIKGVVDNIGWNVDRQLTASKNALPLVKKENEWFLLPQRFPVQIKITDHDNETYPLHVGASATVTVETGASEFIELFWQFGLW
jgi:membrane fusion protein, multidrug efflux system